MATFNEFDRAKGGFNGAVVFTPGATPQMRDAMGENNTIPWKNGSPLTSMPAPMDFSGVQSSAPNIFEPQALQPLQPRQQSALNTLEDMGSTTGRAPFAPVTPQPTAPMTLTPEQARQENIKQGIAAGGTVPLPLGGVGSLEGLPPTDIGDQKAMTPEEIKIQNEFRQGQREQQETQQRLRKAKQETTIRESGAKSAKEKIARSLRDQGITEEAIKNDPRYKDAKTEQERFKAVSAIQKRETLKRVRTEKDQRVASRISKRAKRNPDGTPKNDAAVAEDYDSFFMEENPETGKPLLDLMTPSQKREYKRFNEKASRGNVSDSEVGRIEKIRERVARKVEVAESKRLIETRNKEMQEDIDNAQSKAEKEFYSNLKSQIDGIQERIDQGSYTKKQKAEGYENTLKLQMRELMDTRSAGYQPPQVEQQAQTVTTQAQYDALAPGTEYLNKNGKTSIKPE